jgi:hypothetical protein
MTEQFRPTEIAGYSVSDLGRVKNEKSGRILTPLPNGTGYWKVKLYDEYGYHYRYVHQLVCIAFHGPPEPGQEVNHLNGPNDNRACMIEWTTRKQNSDFKRVSKFFSFV